MTAAPVGEDVSSVGPASASVHAPRRPDAPLAPGNWLGVLGGGQLGRMFCMAAQSLGYRVCVLDPGSDSPAGSSPGLEGRGQAVMRL